MTLCAAGQTPSPKSGSTRSPSPWHGTPIRIIRICRGLCSHLDTFATSSKKTHAQQAKEMQDDPAWVETYGQHFSWHEYWSWAKKPGTYGTFANISSFCRMRDISVDVYAQIAGRKVCIWQERANADDAAAGPICLLRTGNHFDLLVRP